MNNTNIVLALSAENIIRLTGLTMRQLAYWDKNGFFKPEYAFENRKSPNARVYSFNDAVGLRTISTLMNVYNVSYRHLKQVAQELSTYAARPWSELRLRVLKGRVYFDEPSTGNVRDALGNQYAFLDIIDVIQHVREGVEALKSRDIEHQGKFERHRYISHNRLVIAGTRIPVQSILEYVEDGYSTAEIVKRFPLLTEADVKAVTKSGKQAIAA